MFRELAKDGVFELLAFLFAERDGVVMLLTAYFDESERSDQSEPFSMAGYIFKPAGYKHFVRKWARMLKSAGPKPTTHFHATTLYARDDEYDGWTAEERAEVLRQAVDAIRKHAYCGISVLFSQSEFEQIAPPTWRFEYGSIYSAGCQLALRATAHWMDKHHCQIPIAYIFENGHRFWDEANAILVGTAKDPQLKHGYHYHSHTAMDKKLAFGLQAADLLAWTMTKMEAGVAPINHTMRAFAPHFMRLVQDRSDSYQVMRFRGSLLKRFFEEQQRFGPSVIVDVPKARKMRLR